MGRPAPLFGVITPRLFYRNQNVRSRVSALGEKRVNEHNEQQFPAPPDSAGAVPPRNTRRRLVQSFAGLFVAIGLAAAVERQPVAAKKRRKRKKRNRRSGGDGGGNPGGGGNDGGGGGYCPDAEERAFLTLINNHRRANNRSPLSLQDQLGIAAERHSQDQANRDRGGHAGSDGSDAGQRIARAGYDWSTWGESVFWSKPDGSAQAAFTWWKNSPDHNANMLSRSFTEIGIGRARSSSGWWYWTTTFGAR